MKYSTEFLIRSIMNYWRWGALSNPELTPHANDGAEYRASIIARLRVADEMERRFAELVETTATRTDQAAQRSKP